MRIACDIMSGDKHPEELLEGVIQYVANEKVEVVVVGDKTLINKKLAFHPFERTFISVEHSTEIIDMDDDPIIGYKNKKNSSIVKATQLVEKGKVQGLFSPGNTGATLTASLFEIGRIKGVKRPAISALIPTLNGFAILVDAGGNVECKPHFLTQFALMGELFSKLVFKVDNPRVGLLSNGEESKKGTHLVKTVHDHLLKLPLNFIGNIEGYNITDGSVDVIVTDGFTGNVAIKTIEGVAKTLVTMIKKEFTSSIKAKIGALIVKNDFKRVAKVLDSREIGGAPLLGVKGEVIVGHGSADALATYNGLKMVQRMVEIDLSNKIYKSMKENDRTFFF